MQAVLDGVFAVPGDDCIDFPALLRALHGQGIGAYTVRRFVADRVRSTFTSGLRWGIHVMALRDDIPFGMSLPHRSPHPIDVGTVGAVARRAEALGFRDLWVTENTLDHVTSFDPVVLLTYAAAVTSTVRLGASVVVLPVHSPIMIAHQWASLDQVSNGRAILGVGIGRDYHYRQFNVTAERRVKRFREEIELIKTLWTGQAVNHVGDFYHLEGGTMPLRPVQRPHVPIWFGVGHPGAIRRAAVLADGWMGSGGSSLAEFGRSVPVLREALEKAGRDPAKFPTSKRIFVAVDERSERARAELHRWFAEVYHNPAGTDASGIHGTPEHVRERLEEVVAMGANHLLLNPVSRFTEQVEAVAEVVGLG
jgi:probable F420-dependent oxidoreductase